MGAGHSTGQTGPGLRAHELHGMGGGCRGMSPWKNVWKLGVGRRALWAGTRPEAGPSAISLEEERGSGCSSFSRSSPGSGSGRSCLLSGCNSQKCSHSCPVARPGPLAWLSPLPPPGWPHPHNTDMFPQLLGETPKALWTRQCAALHQHIWLLPCVSQVFK